MEIRPKVLIVEDATGVAHFYKELLGKQYETSICQSGEQAKNIIELGLKYDLVILDVVLPVEDENRTLDDCQETGFRLCEMMLKAKIASHYYIITVRSEMYGQFDKLCKQYNAKMKFESKMDHQPEKFISVIKGLL